VRIADLQVGITVFEVGARFCFSIGRKHHLLHIYSKKGKIYVQPHRASKQASKQALENSPFQKVPALGAFFQTLRFITQPISEQRELMRCNYHNQLYRPIFCWEF